MSLRLYMSKNLVIVESPAKAKTIENYLGKDFIVKSSYGHVRDLAGKGLAVDIENNFAPQYEVSSDKKTLVAELKKLAKAADVVWLATDEDREGEAISWHLFETLGLKKQNTKRIAFNEITKTAILRAIENPREINDKLVDAQQARRILDRLVGFELSPVLWKKVKPSLSAGRVQSVAVRLIVEKEREVQKHSSESFYKIQGEFKKGSDTIKADLTQNLGTLEEAQTFLESCKNIDFSVLDVQTKPAIKKSIAPFTTSTLQQEASLKLGFSVSRTMQVAQRLYEAGHITYMRTDSVNLSEDAMNAAKQAIVSNYGEAYSQPQKYTTKSAGAQEAHEAIRPTDFNASEINVERDQARLYDLIWKRAIASQMSDAKLERTTIKIGNEKLTSIFQAKGEVIIFDGFLKVYLESKLDEDEDEENAGLLPKVNEGDDLDCKVINATQRFSRPPARYVEASLVKKLEELGIGRPSTYAPTISTIQKRGYVEKLEREGEERSYSVLSLKGSEISKEVRTEITGRDKNKLSPSDIGIVVNDFLVEHFDKVMNYNFTANVEKQFDDIASGLVNWTEMLKSFYTPFHENVENTLEHSERASGERSLGNHPENGKPIIARIGRFGPMVQIGTTEDEEKPVFASLPPTKSINTITLEEALDLFKLPRIVGEFEGKDMKVNRGRFGPYVQHAGAFTSLGKEDDPMTIAAERAIELIQAKRVADAAKLIKTFVEDDTMQLLNGRYGAYLKIGKDNFKLPKDVVPEDLSYEQCIEISQNQPESKKKVGKAKTATKAKSAATTKAKPKAAAKKKPATKKK
jgi:DNA topoisomerase I